MNIEDFKGLVIQVLKEHGYDVFESDKGNTEKDDSFILESHKAEKRRWHVESWSLFECTNLNESVDLKDIERFYELVLSDNAERGYIITTSRFTEDAVKFIKDKPIELIDGKEFLNLLKKASTPQVYCIECLRIPASIRASLKKLRASIEALNRLQHQSSGKWTAPLHLDLMFGEMVRKVKSAFKTVSKLERKRLETKLCIKIKKIDSSIAKIEMDFESFEKIVRDFSKKEE